MRIIKSGIFIIILFLLWNVVFNILWLKGPVVSYFKEPKNTFDVVYIGSSNVFLHFNSTLAFNEYGFTTGLLSEGAQTPAAIEYLIKESRKYQKPLFYIIDVTKFVDDLSLFVEGNFRNTLDGMPFSWNRIEAINKSLKYFPIDSSEYINYYFSFLKYHNMWKQISKQNFVEPGDVFKGYKLFRGNIVVESQTLPKWDYELEILEEDNQKVLNSLLDYLESEKLNCLFVVPNRGFEIEKMKKMNYVIKTIQNRNHKIINFNEISDIKIDSKNDLFNYDHLNIYGSTKFTLYFSKYLHEYYNLPDHRKDKKYNSWFESYDKMKIQYDTLLKKNFDELVKEDKILLNINN